MIPHEQTFEAIGSDALLRRVGELKAGGWRLAAISAAKNAAGLELIYTFDREYRLLNLRLQLAGEVVKVPSVSAQFFCAALYENELHDLFGLEVENMALDFKGNLYRTAVKFPFGCTKAPAPALAASSEAAKSPAVAAANKGA